MKTDALNRRLRFAKSQPRDKRIDLRERDIVIFEALHRHGPLPTNILFAFAKGLNRNFNAHQSRLTKLYNGTEDGAPYLTRPPQQFASFEARYQPLVYDLAPRAKQQLAEIGRLSRYCVDRKDAFLHRFMTACVGASIELAAMDRGIRYISKAEIFAHAKCPNATKHSANPLAIPLAGFGPATALVPDGLFGLQYPLGGYRFFAVEVDRNTEAIERRKAGANTFARKIQNYCEILRCKSYRAHWGVPNLLVLTVTTSAMHGDNIIDHLQREGDPKLTERFLFKSAAGFGTNWKVPRAPLDSLFDPWRRAGEPFDISKA